MLFMQKHYSEFFQYINSSKFKLIFHEYIYQNNGNYTLLPKHLNINDYFKEVAASTSKMNFADKYFFVFCKTLLEGYHLNELIKWAECIKLNRSFLSYHYAEKIFKFINKNLLDYKFNEYIDIKFTKVKSNFLKIPEHILKCIKLSFYISVSQLNSCINFLINLLDQEKIFSKTINRIEISIDNISTSKGQNTLLHIFFNYCSTNQKNIKNCISSISKIISPFTMPVKHDYSLNIADGITITQGFRIYKKYLNLLDILSEIYSVKCDYSFHVADLYELQGIYKESYTSV
jgi:hypothetical protein